MEEGPGRGRDELRAAALESLDFHAVRRAVADCASFPPARRLALGLTPFYDEHEVDALQRETSEGRALLESVELNLYSPADPSTAVARAALEGVLTGQELIEVADSIELQLRARAALLQRQDRTPILAGIVEDIPDLDELRRQIRRSIGEHGGEVLDSASAAIASIRRRLRPAYERVIESLNRIIQSPDDREALQDNVISVRGERLALQVKADMRHRVPGVVLDASNTGATLFIEPFATVELCNEWRELALEEEREANRILRDLSILVGSVAEDIERGIESVSRLDLILARARYSARIAGIRPIRSGSEGLRLLSARHPLLGDEAVPVDLTVGPDWSVLVITGPNTGGKTVAMKTVGLLAAMHQSGLQVSAEEGSSLPVYEGIYADVGDRQSIEQSVSTFSSHMRNVIDILGDATASSLVLLDEIGTSTDPEEGSALARAILDNLAEHGIATIATTHHRAVAAHAEGHPRMSNASVQLDAKTLLPTYELTLGVPGRSYAMSVAANLGLPGPIMEKAKSLIEPRHVLFEDWLSELQRDRQRLREQTEDMERAGAQARLLRRELEERIDYLATHREEMLDGVRRGLAARVRAGLEEGAADRGHDLLAARGWRDRAGQGRYRGCEARARRGDGAAACAPSTRARQAGGRRRLRRPEGTRQGRTGALGIGRRGRGRGQPRQGPAAHRHGSAEDRGRARAGGDSGGRHQPGTGAALGRPGHPRIPRRRGAGSPGAVPGQGHEGRARIGQDHPRQGDGRAEAGGQGAPGAAPAGAVVRVGGAQPRGQRRHRRQAELIRAPANLSNRHRCGAGHPGPLRLRRR